MLFITTIVISIASVIFDYREFKSDFKSGVENELQR